VGVGTTAIVIGGVTGLLALHDKSRVAEHCGTGGCADAKYYSLQNRRDVEWTIARATFPVGILALGTALTWFSVQARAEKRPHAFLEKRVSFVADPRGSELWITGDF
jgi:hypothetical protein